MAGGLSYYAPVVLAGLGVGAVYALIALGLFFIYQATHLIDFSQGQFVALGGLLAATTITMLHVGLFPALVLAGVVGGLLGLFYELVVLRRTYAQPEMVAILATVGFMLFLLHLQEALWGHSATPVTAFTANWNPTILGVSLLSQYVWIWLLLAAVATSLAVFFRYTLVGRAALAAAQDPLGAALTGIDVPRTRAFALVLGSALAAVAGAAVAPITLATPEIGPNLILYAFTGLIVGGLESPVGAVAGALLVGVFQQFAATLFSYGYSDPFTFLLLLVMLLVRPRGLFAR